MSHSDILTAQIALIKETANNNIVDVIGNYERLKKKGRNYWCKCLFHNENTASMSVSAAKGIYKCFGCGAGGNAIDFLMNYEQTKLSFMEAVKWLGDCFNLPLDDQQPRTYTRPAPRKIQPATATGNPATSYISKEVFNQSLQKYDQNNLVTFLHTLFEPSVINDLIERYYIGTSKYYTGGCIFWQVDGAGAIRSGKVLPYEAATGKRIRNTIEKDGHPLPATNWVHSILKLKDYNLQQCFFGEHLLSDDNLNIPVAIVESEKTAIIASVFIPSFIWIASGSKGYSKFNIKGEINQIPELLTEKFKVLSGRKVVLFPDLGCNEDWQHLANELRQNIGLDISVNDLLQEAATAYNLPDKSDLCDFLTSEAARTEIIERYKKHLITYPPADITEAVKITMEYISKGLRIADIKRAENEIRQDYEIDPATNEIIGLKTAIAA